MQTYCTTAAHNSFEKTDPFDALSIRQLVLNSITHCIFLFLSFLFTNWKVLRSCWKIFQILKSTVSFKIAWWNKAIYWTRRASEISEKESSISKNSQTVWWVEWNAEVGLWGDTGRCGSGSLVPYSLIQYKCISSVWFIYLSVETNILYTT